MEAIVKAVISHYASDFIDVPDVSVSLFRKKIDFNEVHLKKDVFIKQQIPFEVTQSIVGRINGSIKELSKSPPIEVDASDVFALAKLRKDVAIDKEKMFSYKEYSSIDQISTSSGVSTQDIISSSLARILAEFKCKISNIHLRFEYLNDDNHLVAFGVIIPNIRVHNPNETKPGFLTKKLDIDRLSIYMDTEVNPISNESFRQTMFNLMSLQHHSCILEDFSFEGTLEHCIHAVQNAILNRISLKSPALNFKINNIQYRSLLKINNERVKFQQMLYFVPFGRPDSFDDEPQLWWAYANECAKKKCDSLYFNFSCKKALSFLKNRKSMCPQLQKIMKKKESKKKAKLQKIEQIYGKGTILHAL